MAQEYQNALTLLRFSLNETLNRDKKYEFVLPRILGLATATQNLTMSNVEDRYHELIRQANSMVEHDAKMKAAAAAAANEDDDGGPIRRSDGGRKRSSLRRKTKGGGKWSAKYKKSIDCSAPRGFSQRQYCKYGRRKTAKK
jgi:hypothetical protein